MAVAFPKGPLVAFLVVSLCPMSSNMLLWNAVTTWQVTSPVEGWGSGGSGRVR